MIHHITCERSHKIFFIRESWHILIDLSKHLCLEFLNLLQLFSELAQKCCIFDNTDVAKNHRNQRALGNKSRVEVTEALIFVNLKHNSLYQYCYIVTDRHGSINGSLVGIKSFLFSVEDKMHQVKVQPVILGLDHWDLVDKMVNDGMRVPRNHSVNHGIVDSVQKLVELVKLVAVSLEG